MSDLAADNSLGTYTPVQLYAGEAPIVTDHYTANAGVSFAQYEVAAVNAGGLLIKYDNAGAAPANVAVCIVAQPIAAGGTGPVFKAGAFNHAALIWPAGLTTFDGRRAAFQGTDIHIMALK